MPGLLPGIERNNKCGAVRGVQSSSVSCQMTHAYAHIHGNFLYRCCYSCSERKEQVRKSVHIAIVRVRSVTTDTFPSEMLGQPSACDRHKVGTYFLPQLPS